MIIFSRGTSSISLWNNRLALCSPLYDNIRHDSIR
jgi:hypothetical protein